MFTAAQQIFVQKHWQSAVDLIPSDAFPWSTAFSIHLFYSWQYIPSLWMVKINALFKIGGFECGGDSDLRINTLRSLERARASVQAEQIKPWTNWQVAAAPDTCGQQWSDPVPTSACSTRTAAFCDLSCELEALPEHCGPLTHDKKVNFLFLMLEKKFLSDLFQN